MRKIGSFGIVLENKSDGEVGTHSVTMIGRDSVRRTLTGSTMSTAVEELFIYHGQLSEDGRSLTLETEGPAMTPGRTTDRYRDVIHIIDPDTRYTAAEIWLEDNGWQEFMRTTYYRKS